MELGIWSDGITLISFEPFPTAAFFYRVAVPDGWRLEPDNRWPPEWPNRYLWSGVVLRGPAGEVANTCDVLRMAHRREQGFRIVTEIDIREKEGTLVATDDDLREGQEVTYYPRVGKPGHRVVVVSVVPHAFHRALVRFRYADGREREVSIGRFHTTPD